jgi:hypothetical protein
MISFRTKSTDDGREPRPTKDTLHGLAALAFRMDMHDGQAAWTSIMDVPNGHAAWTRNMEIQVNM